jgi:uncharacterized membrane protein
MLMGTSVSLEKHAPLRVEIRRVPMLQSLIWLRRGRDDLLGIGMPSIAHGALIAVLGAVLLIVASTHLFLVAAAVTGYLLVGPVMTTGLCELSRRRAAGESLGFDESLQAVTRNADNLIHFGGLLAAVALLWWIASAVMLQTLPHASSPTFAIALWGGFTDAVSRPQMLGYVGCGAVLAAIVFSLSLVSVPLMIDRHATATEAIWASLKATFWNLPAMLVWGGLIVGLTALGFLTLLVGMVIVAPLLGHATWHAYRDLIR